MQLDLDLAHMVTMEEMVLLTLRGQTLQADHKEFADHQTPSGEGEQPIINLAAFAKKPIPG
jgi:hypothetical protein